MDPSELNDDILDEMESIVDDALDGTADSDAKDKETRSRRNDDYYEFQEEVAEGGIKQILRMRDHRTGRSVAMAKLKADFRSASNIERFLREARTLANLEHPNIVPLYEINYDKEDLLYFTMKLLSGRTLGRILRDFEKDPMPLETLLDVFCSVCDAVAYAHSRSILHLDLKPENIQVSEFGEVLVLDWGFSRNVNEEKDTFDSIQEYSEFTPVTSNITRAGTINGTPGYMSPEQSDEDISKYTEASDIYSLGAILYSILSLKRPFDGKKAQAILKLTRAGEIPDFPEKLNIPPALIAVVRKAMTLDPEERYEDVSSLKDDIQSYLHGFATEAEESSSFSLLKLFYNRNRKIINVIGAAAVITAVTAAFSWQTIEEQRAIAAQQKVIAEEEKEKTALEKSKTLLVEQDLLGFINMHNATIDDVIQGSEKQEAEYRSNYNFKDAQKMYRQLMKMGYDDPFLWERKALLHAGQLEFRQAFFSLDKYIKSKKFERTIDPGLPNVALGKAVSSSPAYAHSHAEMAVNGDVISDYRHDLFVSRVENSWWEVDLGDYYHIKAIKIYPNSAEPADKVLKRFSNSWVLISDTAFNGTNLKELRRQADYEYNVGDTIRKRSISIYPRKLNGTGRYLRIVKEAGSTFELGEVEVYGISDHAFDWKSQLNYSYATAGQSYEKELKLKRLLLSGAKNGKTKLSLINAPPWLKLTQADAGKDATLSGTAEVPGSHSFIIRADNGEKTADARYELEVKSANLALGKKVSSSQAFKKCSAELAVNGNRSSTYPDDIFLSEDEAGWWEVDLGNQYQVEFIDIYFRSNDNQQYEMSNSRIFLSSTPFRGSSLQRMKHDAKYEFQLGNTEGLNKVRIDQKGSFAGIQYIRLLSDKHRCAIGEVEVYGTVYEYQYRTLHHSITYIERHNHHWLGDDLSDYRVMKYASQMINAGNTVREQILWAYNSSYESSLKTKLAILPEHLKMYNPQAVNPIINIQYKIKEGLIELDLSKNPDLYNLDPIIGLPIRKLDISHCPSVQLDRVENFLWKNITELDISYSKQHISDSWQSDAITSLTAKGCTFSAYDTDHLRRLDLEGGHFQRGNIDPKSLLKHFNIAHTNFRDFRALSNFKKLKTLVIDERMVIPDEYLKKMKENGVEIQLSASRSQRSE